MGLCAAGPISISFMEDSLFPIPCPPSFFCRFWLPFLVAVSGCRFWLPFLVAVSGCRFYCRFWLPLQVAVLQGEFAQWYPS